MPNCRPSQAVRIAVLILPFVLMVSHAARAQDNAELELGKHVFTELANPQCSICHMLKDAAAEGAIGPSLDRMQPTGDRVRAAVSGGIGIMPPFEDSLSKKEIDAVARYVATVTGQEP